MDDDKKILITGGTGFIGSYLCEELMRDGHFLTLITRTPKKYAEQSSQNQSYVGWDGDLASEMEKADVVINLTGENLFGQRWTDEVKERLYSSRIDLTKKLVDAIDQASKPPEVLISASGINYYGDSGDELITEDSPSGDDFLAKLCIDWEAEALKAEQKGVRVAIPRISPALESDGGMIEQMKLPFKLFVGGSLGKGSQYLSWIHMYDLCRAILFPMENREFSGPYNACSPNPATMRELATALGKVMNRPSLFKVPEVALKVVLGEAATPVLSSLRAQPKRLQKAGFTFEFEDLEYALADIL